MKEKMINEFEIKINTGFGKNLTYMEDGQLDVIGDYLNNTTLPVDIQLRKFEDEETGEEGEVLAGIEGYYMDLDYIYNENISVFESFDWYSGELYDVYTVLFDGEEYKEEFDVIFNPNLFYISEVYVNEKYKKENYEMMLVNKLDQILNYIGKLKVGVIAIETQNIEKIDNKEIIEAVEKLEEVLTNNNYVKTSSNKNYFVKVIN